MTLLLAAATPATEFLPNGEAFKWGLVGGLIGLLVTQILPAAGAIVSGGAEPRVTLWRAIAALVIVIGYSCAGGAAAIVIGDVATIKDAIVYGMAWEAILGGAVKTGRALLPPPPPPPP